MVRMVPTKMTLRCEEDLSIWMHGVGEDTIENRSTYI
jgi:hypothetical protein